MNNKLKIDTIENVFRITANTTRRLKPETAGRTFPMPKTKKQSGQAKRGTVRITLSRVSAGQRTWHAVLGGKIVAASTQTYMTHNECSKNLARLLKAIFRARVEVVGR